MKSHFAAILSLTLFFSACNFFKKEVPEKPEVTDKVTVPKVSVPTFGVDSAYAFVQKQVDFGPRVPNTKPHVACGDWLIAKFNEYADTVYVQKADLTAYTGAVLKSRNIIASFNPDSPQRIMLCAHWDTRPFSDQDSEKPDKAFDGADDGGSGVGVLLELARVLKMNKVNIGVDLILFDSEDYGQPDGAFPYKPDSYCLGTQYWAKNPHVPGYKAKYGILLDMVGGPGATFPKEGTSMRYAPFVMNSVWQVAIELGYGQFFVNNSSGDIIDDHLYVNQIIGIPTIDIINKPLSGGFASHWHTQNDNMNAIDKNTLNAVGNVLLQVVYRQNAGAFI